ncbi:Mur ligase family protein [Alkaliphilus hydrothermalis]|uniref:UDP-N-acetylmuramoyl-L-alanyl-D-glutamate--2, 6-diaminopimelate ligase n=1 Tax=Alkaliphilus hydrothermalis TaxID=1482730 RepID=A0ABS2NTL2_9FIRM|nr:UDP-N-acetylmuramyl-tripeptide synthetase [Alkaliphilus hydrothermalis]MBM7615909.1 UDP-N-acetylmuramoyl-L-alanyl-D-glutamate--2,6-diaminopimelate ligase [Alkaliphilus hydrothermalis]
MIIDGLRIKGVTCDSRKVKEGYAFVAITGEKQDGNKYIEDAINNGAIIIYTERKMKLEKVKVVQVEDARIKLAELCNQFYQYPAEKLKVIGVTGTNGKTTTTHLIYETLKKAGVSVGIIGTLNIRINDIIYETNLTTPIAEDVCRYLAMMVEQNVEVVVMEVSSHGLKNHRVHGIKFDVAIHTNIEKDHMNFHKTFDDYLKTKKKLFDQLAPGKMAIINFDDVNSLRLLEDNDHIMVITYGLNTKSTITASSIDCDCNISFNYCMQRGITTLSGVELDPFEYPVDVKLLGKHNVYNSLAAITCCLMLDVSIDDIAKALEDFKSLARRMEVIYQKEYTVIDDFCHNPASYQAVLESIQSMQYKNLYIINAIRGNRGEEVNKDNAEVLAQWAALLKAKELCITASRDYCGRADNVSNTERDAFLDVINDLGISYRYEEKLEDSIAKTIKQLEKNDLILLLGSQGMDKAKELFLKMMKDPEIFSSIDNKKNEQCQSIH